jgi:hypothetical protein
MQLEARYKGCLATRQPNSLMAHISGHRQLLDALSSARQQLELHIYVDILWKALAEVDSGTSDSGSLSLSYFGLLSDTD